MITKSQGGVYYKFTVARQQAAELGSEVYFEQTPTNKLLLSHHHRHFKSILSANMDVFSTVFLSDPGIPGVRSMGPSLSNWCFVDLTDVTLVDEDTNSILADDTNRAIPGNLEMHSTNFRISTKFQNLNQISES